MSFSFLTCKIDRIMPGGSKSGNTGNCVISHLWRAHSIYSGLDFLARLEQHIHQRVVLKIVYNDEHKLPRMCKCQQMLPTVIIIISISAPWSVSWAKVCLLSLGDASDYSHTPISPWHAMCQKESSNSRP